MPLPVSALRGALVMPPLFAILACGGGTQDAVQTTAVPVAAPVTTTAPAPTPGVPAGPAIDRIRQRGELLVGIDTGEPAGAGTPPMYFLDAAGKPDGFDYQVARWVATAIGVPNVRVVHGKYSELPELLVDKQQFDLIVSGYTPVETDGIAWSEGYLDFGLCLVVPAKSDVKTVADLWGKDVGLFDDDAAAEAVKTMAKGYTSMVRMEDGYWDALAAGKFAGFIYDYPYAVAELAEWYKDNPKKAGAFRITQYNLTDSTYAAGVRATEPELLAAVNEGLARFRDSDDYATAVRTYLSGGDKTEAPKDQGRVYLVQKGDTLSKIAARELGGAARWKDIWALNKSRFPNPNLIEVDDQVVLPS
ncbi:MAG: transporter substrate-binding domain-containing protein [Pseudomonadota bacterium]|nr:transporter substrate-binding domain-containing protein [Pseudomonadota bacterium]